jgi:hypothetical protein
LHCLVSLEEDRQDVLPVFCPVKPWGSPGGRFLLVDLKASSYKRAQHQYLWVFGVHGDFLAVLLLE